MSVRPSIDNYTLVQMTGYLVVSAYVYQSRLLHGAFVKYERTPGMEVAAGGRVQRGRHLPCQDYLFPFNVGMRR
jgi:hypothetical protein